MSEHKLETNAMPSESKDDTNFVAYMPPESNAGENPHAIIGASTEPGLLKLDVDCLEELFEWLSLKELQALRQTCKRLKQVVDYHIRMNYPLRFGRFEFLDDAFDDLSQFDASFVQLYPQIKFQYTPLSNYVIEGLKHILSHLERVIIYDAQLEGTFHDNFLKFCTNLKSLALLDFSTLDIDNEWLFQQYPTLEHLLISDPVPFEGFEKLQIFLEQNPNIRKLSISSHILDDWMIRSDVKLNILDIDHHDPENDMNHFCNQLNTLHMNGFYKTLHLSIFFECEENEMNEIANLHALEYLYIENLSRGIVWLPLTQLKIFHMHSDRDIDDMNMLVDNLKNIEKLYFESADFESLLPFIHRSSKLKEIRVKLPTDGRFFKKGIIDLNGLNNERKKCPESSPTIIYVREKVYLTTKHAKMRTKFSLIEVKRAESEIFTHGIYAYI